MGILRRHAGIVAVLAAGLGLRLVLAYVVFPNQGLATDLGFFTSWARTLASVGPAGFYASAQSANYPPGYPYLLWIIGLVAQPIAALTGQSADQAVLRPRRPVGSSVTSRTEAVSG